MVFSDDGPGLPQDKMKKVFARGFRLDEQTPGTGLGLNIVKDIVKHLKGSMVNKIIRAWRIASKYKTTTSQI